MTDRFHSNTRVSSEYPGVLATLTFTMTTTALLGLCSPQRAEAAESKANPRRNNPVVAYQTSSSLEASYTGGSDIHRGSLNLGELKSIYTAASYKSFVSQSEQLKWSVGIDWRRFSFGRPDVAPIPHTLQSISAPVGLTYSFNPTWSIQAEVSPGLYSDFEDISWSDVNLPALGGVSYAFNKDLILVAQISYDAWANNPVIGGIGVRWHFAEDWTLSLLMPKPRIEYSVDNKTTLFLGARFLGGSYRVAKDFGQQHSEPELDGQKTDYREIRAGFGAVYKIQDDVTVEVDSGWMIDRRFHFHNRDLLLNGDGAFYSSIAFVARY